MEPRRPTPRSLMACLGEPSRFRLVQALLDGPRCVTDLAAAVGLSQSCTTRHLQVLQRRAVVSGTRDGKRVLYRIEGDAPRLASLLEWALSGGEGGTAPGGRRIGGAGPTPRPARSGPAPARPRGDRPSGAGRLHPSATRGGAAGPDRLRESPAGGGPARGAAPRRPPTDPRGAGPGGGEPAGRDPGRSAVPDPGTPAERAPERVPVAVPPVAQERVHRPEWTPRPSARGRDAEIEDFLL